MPFWQAAYGCSWRELEVSERILICRTSYPASHLIVRDIREPRRPSIVRVKRAQIVRQRGGIAARALSRRLAAQQHAGLGLVIRRHLVSRLYRLTDELEIIVIGLLGADEDADAMLWFGIKITHRFA